MIMRQYKLSSSPLIHTPGMIKYIVLELNTNPVLQARMIDTGWPTLDSTAIDNLIDGKYTHDKNNVYVNGK